MRTYLFLSFLVTTLFFGFPVMAATKNAPMVLSSSQKDTLKEIERYFNSLKSIESKFTQYSSTGAYTDGVFYVLKPGKMRLKYSPPYDIDVFADGYYLIFHDKKLNQVTHLDIDSTPASIILKDNFLFETSGLTISGMQKENGFVSVTLYKTQDPMSGEISLMFQDKPIRLKQWQITDAQRVQTLVTLIDAEFGKTLDTRLFKFVDPRKQVRPGDISRKNR